MIGSLKHWGVPAALLVASAFAACHKKETAKLGNDPKDRESYSLGYQLGTSLKNQNTSVNLDAYVFGLREALAGATSQVSPQELHAAVSDLRIKATAVQQAALKDRAEKNRIAGQAFLDENRKREGVKTLPSGLQYKIVTEGTGNRPQATDSVVVNYRSMLVDGTELANSYQQKKPMTITLGRVIPGWKEALQLMKEGAKWRLFIPAELAYGTRGSSGIGPNSTLIFEVELIRVGAGQAAQGSTAPR